MPERNLKIGKRGLEENPIGQHVTMQWKNRTLIGEIYGVYYQDVPAGNRLQVKHFCGDNWPLDPTPAAVKVLY